jgi:hypothetical protein
LSKAIFVLVEYHCEYTKSHWGHAGWLWHNLLQNCMNELPRLLLLGRSSSKGIPKYNSGYTVYKL